MNKEEFMEYIRENFTIDGVTDSLIDNILCFTENNYDEEEHHCVLKVLLEGTIGLTDDEIEMVCLYKK